MSEAARDAEAGEPRETRLKRLKMRSMRRGIKEMDIILSRFADEALGAMDARALDAYEALLEQNDQDLYQWVTGQAAPPGDFDAIVGEIRASVDAGR